MMRRIAVVGDTLSSGGQISPYSGPAFKMGSHQAALIGGQAFCTACMRPGVIAKSGGPYRIKIMGEVALDGDIVICACPTPPHIVASLGGEKWCDDRVEGNGKVVSSLSATGSVVSIKEGAFDEQVKATEHRVEGLPYFIETADERVHSGRLGTDGVLPRIHTGDSPDDYTVYWGDDALAKQHGEE
ncbi:PAAR domain-containing protein [Burkholderia sp. RS02]|uniref:PAAR domain-containing protein n=1 Tax=unclassified Burkholderia TaxID=2613784 RepID=UPI003218AC3A